MAAKTELVDTSYDKNDELFSAPWLLWLDNVINRFDWDDVTFEAEFKNRQSELKSSAGGKKKTMMSRKSVSRKSVSRKSVSKGGSRKSVSKGGRKSVAGGRKSVAGGRKSVAGGRKSVAGGRKSVAGGRKSVAGGRKSVAGGRKSVAGGRKSVAGGRKSVAGRRQSARKSSMRRRSMSGSRKSFMGKKKTKFGEDRRKSSLLDPRGRELVPPTLIAKVWKRPKDIDPSIEWTLEPENDPLDVWTHNEHLMKSKLMRHIISGIMGLDKIGTSKPFVKELETPYYYPNSGEHWKPRDHVYALTGAGEGTKHNPQYNPAGIYFIRLFFMGKWRRILVDDYFPFDCEGNLLLPRSRNPENIWMQLLTKGLLKIASLSWSVCDETMDFNPICNLTSWICNSIDVSLLQEEPIWKIIQGHAVEGYHPPTRICELVDPNTCIYDAMDVFVDDPTSRSVFIHLPEIMDDSCPMIPCYEGVAYLNIAINDTIPNCVPKWKNYRWIDWAMENGLIRGKPGTTRRIVELFVPLKKIPHIFLEDRIKEEVLPQDKNQIPAQQINLVGQFKCDPYLFNSIYTYFRKIDIYFKRSYFEFAKTIENISEELLIFFKHDKVQKPAAQVQDPNVVKEYFFLISDSSNCKNIFVTLSALSEDHSSPSEYIMCEGYHWRNDCQGPCWFSMRTNGSRTHSLNLGPGLQVCRIWYSLPNKYIIDFHSRSQFYLSGKDETIFMQSIESASLKQYAEEIAEIFFKMLKAPIGTGYHGELLGQFIASFCPPNLKNAALPPSNDTQGLLRQIKIEKLFQEKLMELLFENENDPEKLVAVIQKYKEFFLDRSFGESYLESFPEHEPILQKLKNARRANELAHRQAKKEFTKSIDSEYQESSKKSLKTGSPKKGRRQSAKKSDRRTSSKGERRQSSKKSIRRASSKRGSVKKKDGKTPYTRGRLPTKTTKPKKKEKEEKPEEKKLLFSPYLLDFPENNITLLKKMLDHEEEVLAHYPFRYDVDLKLVFHDYTGSTDVTVLPFQDWIPIIVMVLNVHSETPVPCGFFLFTDNKGAILELHDLDSNIEIPLNYDVNATCNLVHNNCGYVLLAATSTSSLDLSKQSPILWRVRVFGPDHMNLPHPCLLKPKSYAETAAGQQPSNICIGSPGEQPTLKIESISGYYYPNPKNHVCRFLIKVDRTVITNLSYSPSKKDAQCHLTIKGLNNKVIVDECRKGEIVTAALTLDFNDAEFQQAVEGLESFYYFLGEVEVYADSWPLTIKDVDCLETNLRKYSSSTSTQPAKTEGDAKLTKVPGSSKKTAKRASVSATNLHIEPGPQWKVTLYTEARYGSGVSLVLDKRFEISFQKKKAMIWDVENPERSEIGRDLRYEYIKSVRKTSGVGSVDSDGMSLKHDDSRTSISSLKKKHKKKTLSKQPDIMSVIMSKEDYPFGPKLLPPLIDKYSLPVSENVIPIVLEPFAIPTSAPLHLGPFTEELPSTPPEPDRKATVESLVESYGEEGEQEEEHLESEESLGEFKVDPSQISIHIKSIADLSEEFNALRLKDQSDKVIDLAFKERDRIVADMQTDAEVTAFLHNMKPILKKRGTTPMDITNK